MTTKLQAGTAFPPGQPGTIILRKSNSIGARFAEPADVEWFECSSIEASGGWIVPETVNGYYYVHDDGKGDP